LGNHIVSKEDLTRRSKEVIKAVQEGWLHLRIEHVLELADAAKAHELLEGRKTTGKVILRCNHSPF
jgi:NADPH2:quinone reductase